MEAAIVAFLAAIVVFGLINFLGRGKSTSKREDIARQNPTNAENIVKLAIDMQKGGEWEKVRDYLKNIDIQKTDYWSLIGIWMLMLEHWKAKNYSEAKPLAFSIIENLKRDSDTEIQIGHASYVYGAIIFNEGDINNAAEYKKIGIKYDKDCVSIFDTSDFPGYEKL